MSDEEFLAIANAALPELRQRYFLSEWWIFATVVNRLSEPGHIAECHLDEPRRVADIRVSRRWLRRASREEVLSVLEHEVHHVVLYPLDALMQVALTLCDGEVNQEMLRQEFIRCNERLRTALGRITGKGNNWAVAASVQSEG